MTMTPELEIAWARAVARAVDDPAFAERLKHFPRETLQSLGTEIPDDVDPDKDLHPTQSELTEAAERYRAAQANAAESAGTQIRPRGCYSPEVMCRRCHASVDLALGVSAQASGPPAPTASAPGSPTASAPYCFTASMPTASIHPMCYCGGSYGTASMYTASMAPMCHCGATRPTASGISSAPATPREEPPQWLGSRPSTGGL